LYQVVYLLRFRFEHDGSMEKPTCIKGGRDRARDLLIALSSLFKVLMKLSGVSASYPNTW